MKPHTASSLGQIPKDRISNLRDALRFIAEQGCEGGTGDLSHGRHNRRNAGNRAWNLVGSGNHSADLGWAVVSDLAGVAANRFLYLAARKVRGYQEIGRQDQALT